MSLLLDALKRAALDMKTEGIGVGDPLRKDKIESENNIGGDTSNAAVEEVINEVSEELSDDGSPEEHTGEAANDEMEQSAINDVEPVALSSFETDLYLDCDSNINLGGDSLSIDIDCEEPEDQPYLHTEMEDEENEPTETPSMGMGREEPEEQPYLHAEMEHEESEPAETPSMDMGREVVEEQPYLHVEMECEESEPSETEANSTPLTDYRQHDGKEPANNDEESVAQAESLKELMQAEESYNKKKKWVAGLLLAGLVFMAFAYISIKLNGINLGSDDIVKPNKSKGSSELIDNDNGKVKQVIGEKNGSRKAKPSDITPANNTKVNSPTIKDKKSLVKSAPKKASTNNKTVSKKQINNAKVNNRKKIVKSPAPLFEKKRIVNATGYLLQEAYASFHRGDYNAAEEYYMRVLNKEKDNRDALLGQAAVGLKNGNLSLATELYSRLLEVNPEDVEAQSGMLLLNKLWGEADINSLGLLLDSNSSSAPLNFIMGNIHADRQRWVAANENFKKAYFLDKGSPDYAFNLAVSFDHIGGYDNAQRFYEISLRLARHRSYNFLPNLASERINALKPYVNLDAAAK